MNVLQLVIYQKSASTPEQKVECTQNRVVMFSFPVHDIIYNQLLGPAPGVYFHVVHGFLAVFLLVVLGAETKTNYKQ